MHPDHLEEPGDGDAVHGLDHRAGERGSATCSWNGYPQPVEGGKQAFAELVKEEPSIDVDLEALADSALEYRLDDPEARQLWTEIFTEVKAG